MARTTMSDNLVDRYYALIRHIEVTSEYGINRGRNLWVDPYYVRELRHFERIITTLNLWGK